MTAFKSKFQGNLSCIHGCFFFFALFIYLFYPSRFDLGFVEFVNLFWRFCFRFNFLVVFLVVFLVWSQVGFVYFWRLIILFYFSGSYYVYVYFFNCWKSETESASELFICLSLYVFISGCRSWKYIIFISWWSTWN